MRQLSNSLPYKSPSEPLASGKGEVEIYARCTIQQLDLVLASLQATALQKQHAYSAE